MLISEDVHFHDYPYKLDFTHNPSSHLPMFVAGHEACLTLLNVQEVMYDFSNRVLRIENHCVVEYLQAHCVFDSPDSP